MDNRRHLEEQKILLGFRQRQLQLDLEEFELNKKLSMLKDETHTPSSQRLSEEGSNSNDFLITLPKEPHIIIDLTIDEPQPKIKAEPDAADNSDTSKLGLSAPKVDNSHVEDSTPKDSLSLGPQTQPLPLSSIQNAGEKLPDQQNADHVVENPTGDPTEADEQPQSSSAAVESVDTTVTPEVAATPDDSAEATPSVIPSTATSRQKTQQGRRIIDTIHVTLSASGVSSTSAQSQTKQKQSSNPKVKRKADQLSKPANPEKSHIEREEHPAGLGPRKAARLRKTLPKNNRLHRGSYVSRTPILDRIERDHNAVLATFCATLFPDLLSDSWTSYEEDEIRSIWDKIRPPLELLEFETMEAFASELRDAAKAVTHRVEAEIKKALEFFQSEWQLCWEECRKKETLAEQLELARSWIHDLDRELGVGP
jgi:hypothetical protein